MLTSKEMEMMIVIIDKFAEYEGTHHDYREWFVIQDKLRELIEIQSMVDKLYTIQHDTMNNFTKEDIK